MCFSSYGPFSFKLENYRGILWQRRPQLTMSIFPGRDVQKAILVLLCLPDCKRLAFHLKDVQPAYKPG